MSELRNLQQKLLKLGDAGRQRLFPDMSAEDYAVLLQDETALRNALRRKNAAEGPKRWFDVPRCGLSRDGQERLDEMQKNSTRRADATERKQLRYLKQLQGMTLKVPDTFRSKVSPKEMYRKAADFCTEHDIPRQIVSQVVPALMEYMETGRFRPIIFVGERGCGKTTAVRLLMENLLCLPVEVVKVPQLGSGFGINGYCGSYQSADVGVLAKARLRKDTMLVAYLFDEIDKAPQDEKNSVEDQLLSVTDESVTEIYDNFLETTLEGLEHCPMFFTANHKDKINPILMDRCTVIHYPNPDRQRLHSIAGKFLAKKLESPIYDLIRVDEQRLYQAVERLADHDVTSLRKHQQLIENVLRQALDEAFEQEGDEKVVTTERMFSAAENSVLGIEKARVGFHA